MRMKSFSGSPVTFYYELNTRKILRKFKKKASQIKEDGKTALYQAVEKGHVEVVRELLAAGASTEVTNKEGETPLIRGARKKHTQCVRLLLEKGADPSVTDRKGDTALHIAVRSKYAGLCEVLLKDPRNSRLLYKPNKSGETPYSIDRTNKQSVLTSIFGNRQISGDISRMELPSGQDTFVMALADFVSEPNLNTPMTVGLYSRWGSGKSLAMQKLQEQLRDYAHEEVIIPFRITSGVVWFAFCVTFTFGLTVWAAASWVDGLLTALAMFVVLMGAFALARNATKGHGGSVNRFGYKLAAICKATNLLSKLIYCVPPSIENVRTMLPVHFLLVDLSKSSLAGENPLTPLVHLAQELNDTIERDLGFVIPRLYRVFRAAPYRTRRASHMNLKPRWKTSCCCIPSVVFSIFVLIFLWTGLLCFAWYGTDESKVVTGIEIASCCIIGGAVLINIPRVFVMLYCLVLSMKKRVLIVSSQPGIREETFMHVLKQEIDLMTDMMECLDGFARHQTRIIIFVDLLEALEQQKVLHFVNSLNALLSEGGHPFVTIISVDPRLLLKAIDQNLSNLHDSHISPHDYLKNTVDLPCYIPEATKVGLSSVIPAEVTSQLTEITLSDNENEEVHHNELEWDGEADFSHHEDEDQNYRAECNGNIPLIDQQSSVIQQRLESNESLEYSEDRMERGETRNGRLQPTERDRISTDLSQLLRDSESGTVSDIKRIMNIVALTGRLLRAKNISFRWKRLASWVSIGDGWPYKTTWLILLSEDTNINLHGDLTLRKLYNATGYAMPAVGDPDLATDGDLVYFETFLSSHQPLLKVEDIRSYLPCTFHIDPYIRKQMGDYLQAIRSGVMPKQLAVGAKSPRMISPSSSRFMWRGVVDDAILSQMTVEEVARQLAEIDGLSSENIQVYQTRLKENNINGNVLAACDVNELRDAMKMTFGDWQLFKAWIIASRTHEQTNTPRPTLTGLSQQSHSSHPDSIAARSDSTSELPNSPSTCQDFRDVSGGSEHASIPPTRLEDPTTLSGVVAKSLMSKGPYGPHMARTGNNVRPVKSQNKQKPTSQTPRKSPATSKDPLVIVHEPPKNNQKKSEEAARNLNAWQRSADSGFASTEVETQQGRSRPLMRQTSVQEGREAECDNEKVESQSVSSKGSSKSDLRPREFVDENGIRRRETDKNILSNPIPEIHVRRAPSLRETSRENSTASQQSSQKSQSIRDELQEVLGVSQPASSLPGNGYELREVLGASHQAPLMSGNDQDDGLSSISDNSIVTAEACILYEEGNPRNLFDTDISVPYGTNTDKSVPSMSYGTNMDVRVSREPYGMEQSQKHKEEELVHSIKKDYTSAAASKIPKTNKKPRMPSPPLPPLRTRTEKSNNGKKQYVYSGLSGSNESLTDLPLPPASMLREQTISESSLTSPSLPTPPPDLLKEGSDSEVFPSPPPLHENKLNNDQFFDSFDSIERERLPLMDRTQESATSLSRIPMRGNQSPPKYSGNQSPPKYPGRSKSYNQGVGSRIPTSSKGKVWVGKPPGDNDAWTTKERTDSGIGRIDLADRRSARTTSPPRRVRNPESYL